MLEFPQFCLADEDFVCGKDRSNQASRTSTPFPSQQICLQEGEERREEQPPEPCPFPVRGQDCSIARRGGVEFLEPLSNRWLAELAGRGLSFVKCRHYARTCNRGPTREVSRRSTPARTPCAVIERMQSSVPRGHTGPPWRLQGRQKRSLCSTITACSL